MGGWAPTGVGVLGTLAGGLTDTNGVFEDDDEPKASWLLRGLVVAVVTVGCWTGWAVGVAAELLAITLLLLLATLLLLAGVGVVSLTSLLPSLANGLCVAYPVLVESPNIPGRAALLNTDSILVVLIFPHAPSAFDKPDDPSSPWAG